MAEHLPAELIRTLVAMANANDASTDGSMRPVMELLDANDVVFGVWQDSTAPDVWTHLIKGANRLREIISNGASVKCRVTAITCLELEQAEALRVFAGTDRTH